jgi:hypothetical protein
MEIQYSITEQDITHFQNYQMVGSNKHRKFMMYGWLSILIIIAIFMSIKMIKPFFTGAMTFDKEIALISVVIAMMYMLFLKRQQKQNAKPLTLSIQISVDSLTYKDHENNIYLQLNWNAIPKIEEDEKCIFIYRDANNAFLLPKRSFSSVEECNSFLNLMRSWKSGFEQAPHIQPRSANSHEVSVTYTLNKEDIVHLHWAAILKVRPMIFNIFAMVMCTLLLIIAPRTIYLAIIHKLTPLCYQAFPMFILCPIFGYFTYSPAIPLANAKRLGILGNLSTFTTDNKGFTITYTSLKVEHPWSYIDRIFNNKHVCVLYAKKTQDTYCIPRSAFTSDSEFSDFISLLKLCKDGNADLNAVLTVSNEEQWPPAAGLRL